MRDIQTEAPKLSDKNMKAEYVLNKSELDKFAAMLEEMQYRVIRTNDNSFKAFDAQGRLKKVVKVRV